MALHISCDWCIFVKYTLKKPLTPAAQISFRNFGLILIELYGCFQNSVRSWALGTQ